MVNTCIILSYNVRTLISSECLSYVAISWIVSILCKPINYRHACMEITIWFMLSFHKREYQTCVARLLQYIYRTLLIAIYGLILQATMPL